MFKKADAFVRTAFFKHILRTSSGIHFYAVIVRLPFLEDTAFETL